MMKEISIILVLNSIIGNFSTDVQKSAIPSDGNDTLVWDYIIESSKTIPWAIYIRWDHGKTETRRPFG